MLLSKTCLKIDKLNAKAMVIGFTKNGKHYRQSVWLAAKDGEFPSLLTLQRSRTRFKGGQTGSGVFNASCDAEKRRNG